MFIPNTYVRVPMPEDEDLNNPREFLCGQIISEDEQTGEFNIRFNDPFGYRQYYSELFNPITPYPKKMIQRCGLYSGSKVLYQGKEHTVLTRKKRKDVYNYLLQESNTGDILEADETEIIAGFNNGQINPLIQMLNYEFQNPAWFGGRSVVQKNITYLNNMLYGFKDLAGAKINLLPHQLEVIMRCLSSAPMRYMLADEVGMGKTIEALCVLKIFLEHNGGKKILIVVPDAMKEQWRMELLLKFGLEPGTDRKCNVLQLMSASDFQNQKINLDYDLVIADEVHKMIKQKDVYDLLRCLMVTTPNVLLLSATPVRHQKEEYLRLLTLLEPKVYSRMSVNEFSEILEKQKKIMNLVLSVQDTLEEMLSELGEDDEDLLEEYFEEISDDLGTLIDLTSDSKLKELSERVDFSFEDYGIAQIQQTIAYLAEAYQVEKNILKNRRKQLERREDSGFELAKRHLIDIPYELDSVDSAENTAYQMLIDWAARQDLEQNEIKEHVYRTFQAFFSSPWALMDVLENGAEEVYVSPELLSSCRKWMTLEEKVIDVLPALMEDPEQYPVYSNSRIYKVFNFLDQEIEDDKAVVFVSWKKTFEAYQKIFSKFPSEWSAFFDSSQETSMLEENSYKFQNDPKCKILLSDPTGGEGRNFQNASYVVHVDLPWDASVIEQRIGRLDRLERDQNHPDVYSCVIHSRDTIEDGLFQFWNKGLNIFKHSLSGLEIIMSEINERLLEMIKKNLHSGIYMDLSEITDLTKKMITEVQREQNFDIISALYAPMTNDLEAQLEKYLGQENQVFLQALLSWASLAGYNGKKNHNNPNIFTFYPGSFSLGSAKKSLIIPPSWKEYTERADNKYLLSVLEKLKKNPDRAISGTFMRNIAVKNDFIHFFAPGDEVFDSIIDNALRNYKGQCAAFRTKANFNWTGFVFCWKAVPNERDLLLAGIPQSVLARYRRYLHTDLISIPVALSNPDDISPAVINRLLQFCREHKLFNSTKMTHLGRRKKKTRVIDGEAVRVSEVDLFKERYPKENWKELVKESYEKSLAEAKEQINRYSRPGQLKKELDRAVAMEQAKNIHYGIQVDLEKIQNENAMILKALRTPTITLDSVIYLEVEKEYE
ncbi:helicase-related protein [Faecalibaculum rodentium]|uniref:helicase-related protein n=1 Tax=Faecalibaculum rodentium TaxID=1702221 RepID=UPI0023F540D2|nr:helicase-related protein [Faecalibaculum rodentium]